MKFDDLHTLDEAIRKLEERESTTGFKGLCYRTVDWWRTCHVRVREFPRSVKWGYQRVVRGWDDRSVWSLDSHLSDVLGQQLVRMSEIAHGYPCEGYTPESWQAALREHGEALRAYAQSWHLNEYGEEYDAVYVPAQDALHWVADNLAKLWD